MWARWRRPLLRRPPIRKAHRSAGKPPGLTRAPSGGVSSPPLFILYATMASKPSLRTELLLHLAFLAAAALLLGLATVLLVAAAAPDRAVPFIILVVTLDV